MKSFESNEFQTVDEAVRALIERMTDDVSKFEASADRLREEIQESEKILNDGRLPEDHPAQLKYKSAHENLKKSLVELEDSIQGLKDSIEDFEHNPNGIDELKSEKDSPTIH